MPVTRTQCATASLCSQKTPAATPASIALPNELSTFSTVASGIPQHIGQNLPPERAFDSSPDGYGFAGGRVEFAKGFVAVLH